MQTNPYGLEALWQQGDWVIKSVAMTLLLMSLISWSVILIRSWHLWRMRRQMKNISVFWACSSLDEAMDVLGKREFYNVFRYLSEQGYFALQHHRDHQSSLQAHIPLNEWLSGSLRTAIDESGHRLQRGLAALASVGATAPFVGLFGTVWGIYHALVSIGVSGQASIDKVAGPVGEALIMTALGLAVAIPAVLAYNALVRMNKNVITRLSRFAQQLHTYLITGAAPAGQPAGLCNDMSEARA